MDILPAEVIENILKLPILSIKDVINFSSTCHYFRDIVTANNSLWKYKFRSGWPDISDIKVDDYYNEIKYMFTFLKGTQAMLENMPGRFCKKYEISESELQEWDELLVQKPHNYWYLVDYFTSIVNTCTPIDTLEVVPLCTPGNKTLQYYASKVLRHIRQLYLAKEWIEFKNLPKSHQLLEYGAVFVAQWCQPNVKVTRKGIGDKLDEIAMIVLKKLRLFYPQHSIFKASESDFLKWKMFTLESHQWNQIECRQIMGMLREVLYNDLGFNGNNVAYYCPQNSFINEVLDIKQGLPITLAIVFEAVARRLGLKCDPISFPAHFLLRFNENEKDWYYIDVFNGGNIVTRGACPHSRYRNEQQKDGKSLPAATAVQVVERIANNLEVSARQYNQVNGRVTRLRSSLELLKLVNPQDISALVSLARLYMMHSMDTRPLERFLLEQEFEVPEQAQRVVHMLRDYETHHSRGRVEQTTPVEASCRTSDLKFAVGMVMMHLAHDYKCVIYDWDPECLASDDWQIQMNVQQLSLGAKQPFYNVVVEDGSHRYVAQENLYPTVDTGFLYLNDDVGRHFSHFYQTHYVPNADKEREYPQDRAVRLLFHQQLLKDSLLV